MAREAGLFNRRSWFRNVKFLGTSLGRLGRILATQIYIRTQYMSYGACVRMYIYPRVSRLEVEKKRPKRPQL